MGEFVQVDRGGDAPDGVATIRLDRPPMNALNTALQEELRVAARQVSEDPAIRAVVLYGGEKGFAPGSALGGGCELALTADFRVSADNARWGQPEILLGIIPGAGGTQRLPRLVGPAKAKDLIFTGRFVDADEALAIGLADEVVPAADVYAAALAWARKF